MMAVLTKVVSTHNNLERDVYTGSIARRPSVGDNFRMDTKEDGLLITTPVRTVRFLGEGVVEFDTQNSTYKLEYISGGALDAKVFIDEVESAVLTVFIVRNIVHKASIIEYLRRIEKKLLGEAQ